MPALSLPNFPHLAFDPFDETSPINRVTIASFIHTASWIDGCGLLVICLAFKCPPAYDLQTFQELFRLIGYELCLERRNRSGF